MGLTHFPHGIFATPNIGGSRIFEVWNSNNIFFVDGDGGMSINDGLSPESAVTKPSEAIALAQSRGPVIYVKPRTTSASAQTYYTDDIVIPLTLPNTSIIGAGFQGCTNSFSGVQIGPTTVGGHLIDVLGAGANIENMRLTLRSGTADAAKSIIHAVATTSQTAKPSGLTVRYCRFSSDKSHPGYTSTDAIACIGLGSASQVIIEGNVFYDVLGGISYQNTSGTANDIQITGNKFCGPVADRDCDILLNISDSSGVMIVNNVFSDGKPAHSGGSFTKFVYLAGGTTGVMAGNYFSTGTENSIADSTGTDCVIPTTFFCPCNWYEGVTNTAPYGIVTAT